MYLMITVMSHTEKLKASLKALKGVGIKTNLVIDGMGTTNIDNNYIGYRPALETTLMSISESSQYRKVILSVIDSEEMVEKAMDEVQKALGNNLKKPNTGIMFTIPLLGLVSRDPSKNMEFKPN